MNKQKLYDLHDRFYKTYVEMYGKLYHGVIKEESVDLDEADAFCANNPIYRMIIMCRTSDLISSDREIRALYLAYKNF